VVVRNGDSLEDLEKKVHYATILGCLQSTLTKFRFVSAEWKRNAEEERLLGVSLTGTRDHEVLNKVSREACEWLDEMKQSALRTAKSWSEALGINMPAAITCVKPSGTVSQLVNCSSGIHPRFARHYIRRVRVSSSDPIAQLMKDRGVPHQPEVGHTLATTPNVVFEFPITAPDDCVTRHHVSALEQCNYWLMFKNHWCEHNPSVTIYCKPDEWPSVGGWVYQNWDRIGGMTFFPEDNGNYQLAPYEEITGGEYEVLASKMPEIDYSDLDQYEQGDETEGSRELACAGGACEL
jgi:ribonucleoside-triphosphate reductase (thioredoxin)